MVQRSDDDADGRDERTAGESGTPGDGGVAPRSQRDFDERWEQIVAELGDDVSGAWADGAASPDDATRADDEPDGAMPAEGRGGRVVRPAAEPRDLSGRDWAGSDQYEAAEDAVDDLEHFVPPDPGPVLGNDPLRTMTWSVAVGVPVLWVIMLVAWHNPPGWLAPVAAVLFLGAVGVLVWRMPHHRDPGGGTGAVV